MPERVLTTAELNRAVLARQLLLERAELPPEEAVARVAGLQTQYAPTGYVGLAARLRGFHRDDLTGALHAGRVVQAWMMRCTIHMLAAVDHRLLTAAVRASRRQWWLRVAKPVTEDDLVAAAAHVRRVLAEGPRKQVELQRALADAGLPPRVWPGVQLWVDLVRVPPAGTWGTPRAHVYGLAEHVVPASGPEPTEEEGRDALVARYLGAFGPASAADVASFCGWTVTAARAVLARLELRRFRDEAGGELLDVPDGALLDADAPAPVRFLGPWEAVLLVHCRRAQVLPEEHRQRVFATSMPQSVPTVLVDGRVAGTWRWAGGAVRVEPFAPLDAADARAVDEEAERLAALHRGERVSPPPGPPRPAAERRPPRGAAAPPPAAGGSG